VQKDIFSSAAWYRALTIEERADLLRKARRRGASAKIDRELSKRELDLWRAQPPFDRGEWFARFLAASGIDESELGEISIEPIESVAERIQRRPEWLAEIEQAYGRPPPPALEGAAQSPGDDPARAFLEPLEPLIRSGRERLERRIADLARDRGAVPFDPTSVADLFLARLRASLHPLIERVFVLELNVARMQGELEGLNASERFESFSRRLRRDGAATALLAEYPVLARRVVETVAAWERASFELLDHLCADWTSLWAAFSPERDPGRLVRVSAGAGDVHRGGRSVAIVEFESGLRAVYKPRSLAVDVHFQELLEWLDRDGAESDASAGSARPRFRTLRVLDRRDHGWVEFVEPRACASREELRRFYRRQGAYLALLHALDAVDFHFENLIAAGEHPMLVDLETLFHPRLPQPESRDADHRLVREATSRSVLRTGLLPNRTWAQEGEDEGADVSGLGGGGGELAPDALLHWSGTGTDEMQAVKKRVPLPAGKNLPALEGGEASALEHVEDVVKGFEELSLVLVRRRDDLLRGLGAPGSRSDGPIARFENDDVRVVLRPTRAYGLLLAELTHPDFLRDALEYERLLDKLWVGVDEAPHMIDVIGAERDDLARGDVPFFAARPSSRDLSSSGGDRWEKFLPESGWELVERRLRARSAAEIERQAWFIRGAFATSAVEPEKLRWPKYEPIDASDPAVKALALPPALHDALIDRARRIGDRIDELALLDSAGNAAWIGFKFEQRWQLVPLPDDLYSGVPGVVQFLAQLGAITREERYTALARAALAPLRLRVRERRANLGPIGAFNGLGGIVYAFAHCARSWNDAELLREAGATAELAAERIDEDEDLDIIGGAAGLIAALESLRIADPSERWVDIARRAGERLLARSERMQHGIGWRTRLEKNRPATGFSHGASGIAFALRKLHALTGDARYRDAAMDAIEYEASQFDAEAGNWLDPGGQVKKLRTQDATLMVAWCYGAPGVGLARLGLLESEAIAPNRKLAPARLGPSQRALLERDLAIAIATTRAKGFGRNHSLCHGDLGNLDFLARAARVARDPELMRFVELESAMILASIERDGVLCGMPLGVESVSLMSGLAGVGLGLLRVAQPERVPSVLTLDPPMDPSSRSGS
jgi:type 2 lantibiotic biosynthesis protein LanM